MKKLAMTRSLLRLCGQLDARASQNDTEQLAKRSIKSKLPESLELGWISIAAEHLENRRFW